MWVNKVLLYFTEKQVWFASWHIHKPLNFFFCFRKTLWFPETLCIRRDIWFFPFNLLMWYMDFSKIHAWNRLRTLLLLPSLTLHLLQIEDSITLLYNANILLLFFNLLQWMVILDKNKLQKVCLKSLTMFYLRTWHHSNLGRDKNQ